MTNTPYLVFSEIDKEEFYRGDDKELAHKIAIEKSMGRRIVLLGIEKRSFEDPFLSKLYGSHPTSIYMDRFRGGHEDSNNRERVLIGESQLDFVVEQLLGLKKQPSE